MTLNLNHDITDLKGADYNPRKIDDESINMLCDSIEKLGLVKPLIARGKTLVAGHQRTKALRKIGVEKAPVYSLGKKANTYDEVRFNQLHNGTDLDSGDENAQITFDVSELLGYTVIQPKFIKGNFKASLAVVRKEIVRLINKYGPWGGVVATQSGEVIHCAQYALAAAITRTPLTAFIIPDDRKDEYQKYLNHTYGVFSYDHLNKDTYIQTFAQMHRLRGGVRDNKSPTYEKLIIPWLKQNPDARVLDFGCGQGDYVNRLSRKGYNIIGMEFFRRKGAESVLDLTAVNKMVDALVASIRRDGAFDAVICDYVLNSVDSHQAEQDVVNCLDAFCKVNGTIFFSGRSRERLDALNKQTYCNDNSRYVEFMDDEGFTALYRKGHWFYQKYHTQKQIDSLCKRRGWEKRKQIRTAIGWNVQVCKSQDKLTWSSKLESIEREFNLPYNREGLTLNRHNDVLEVVPCLQS